MGHERCPLPFHQLYLHSSGRVYPCGFLQNNILIGDVKKSSLKEIWNGESLKEFRELHKSGKHPSCQENQEKYNCHLLHLDMDKFQKEKNELKRLDFMIDSFCNLKCTMCTNIFEEAEGFTDDKFWDELSEFVLPELDQIEVIGGEPFVLKDTFRLMKLGAKANPDLKWWFTTNGHFDFNKSFTKLLDPINIHSMAISIDSLDPEKFAKIRTGGELSKVLTVLDKFIDYRETRDKSKPFYLVVNFVVQIDNAKELPDFIRFCKEKGVKHYPILLREPQQFSILNEKASLLRLLDFYIEENFELKDHKLMNTILKMVKHIDKEEKLNRIEILEKLSGTIKDG